MSIVMIRTNIRGNIRAEVARAGRSQCDVAAAAGIPRSTWYLRMREPDGWTVGELQAIAGALNIPLQRLTSEEE